MQKAMRLAAAAALLAIAPIAAQAQGQAFVTVSAGRAQNRLHNNDTYVDLGKYGINRTGNSTDNKDIALGVTGGYRWMIDDDLSIGPEVGFVDLGEAKGRSDYELLPEQSKETTHGSVKSKAALIGVNAKWMLDDNWSIGLRTGFIHMWVHSEGRLTGTDFSTAPPSDFSERSKYSGHDNGYYGALNVGYDFTRNAGVTIGYEHYHSDIKTNVNHVTQKIGVWMASFEYRF